MQKKPHRKRKTWANKKGKTLKKRKHGTEMGRREEVEILLQTQEKEQGSMRQTLRSSKTSTPGSWHPEIQTGLWTHVEKELPTLHLCSTLIPGAGKRLLTKHEASDHKFRLTIPHPKLWSSNDSNDWHSVWDLSLEIAVNSEEQLSLSGTHEQPVWTQCFLNCETDIVLCTWRAIMNCLSCKCQSVENLEESTAIISLYFHGWNSAGHFARSRQGTQQSQCVNSHTPDTLGNVCFKREGWRSDNALPLCNPNLIPAPNCWQ